MTESVLVLRLVGVTVPNAGPHPFLHTYFGAAGLWICLLKGPRGVSYHGEGCSQLSPSVPHSPQGPLKARGLGHRGDEEERLFWESP